MSEIKDLVEEIICGFSDYLLKKEKVITELEKDIAVIKAKTYELRAQKKIAEQYFNNQLIERQRIFSFASKVLDKAMESGDEEYAKVAIIILEVVQQKSPFSFN